MNGSPFISWLGKVGGVTVLFSAVLLQNGCYYDVQEELNPVQGNDCDTSDVSFAADILPVLEANCYTCHSVAANLGGVTIEGYDNLMTVVNDGRFAGAVNHESGFSPMPKDAAKLSDCNLAMINTWIDNGAPNN